MIAVFSDEARAIALCDKIHDWLGNNCEGYNAERWQVPIKHPTKNKWGVILPVEILKDVYPKAKDLRPIVKKITDYADNIIEKLPSDFYDNQDLNFENVA